ncbi:MAG: hypothetical protein LBM64_04950 [Deltaproteobacteria bacterium]|jgi:hypothetical protein|nr:hypothetical protein [Deltaproteobacteria bacterium]
MKIILQSIAAFFLVFSFNVALASTDLPRPLQWDMLDWIAGITEQPTAPPDKGDEGTATSPDKGDVEKAAEKIVFKSNKPPLPASDKPGIAVLSVAPPGFDVVGSSFAPDGKADSVIHVAIKEPGASVSSLRIDNLGGKAARWQSEIVSGAMPMAVYHDGVLLNPGGGAFSLPGTNGDGEQLFAIVVQDNGAIEADTKLRLTIFLDNKQRRYASIEKDAKGE